MDNIRIEFYTKDEKKSTLSSKWSISSDATSVTRTYLDILIMKKIKFLGEELEIMDNRMLFDITGKTHYQKVNGLWEIDADNTILNLSKYSEEIIFKKLSRDIKLRSIGI